MFSFFDQIQCDYLLPEHSTQFGRELDGLLNGHYGVLCPVLEEKGGSIPPDIRFGIGSLDSFRNVGYFPPEQQGFG